MWMRHRGKKDKKISLSMVGATGFEPVTPAVSRQWFTVEHGKIKQRIPNKYILK